MALYSMWVHGNSAAIQFPGGGNAGSGSTPGSAMRQVHDVGIGSDINWTDVVGERTGPRIVFTGQDQTSNWFHFSIPTPVFIRDENVVLQTIYILFDTSSGSTINQVYAFDGPNFKKVWAPRAALVTGMNHEGIGGRGATNLSDDQNGPAWDVIRYDVGGWQMSWGLGISVEVSFGQNTSVTFTGAGADFIGPG